MKLEDLTSGAWKAPAQEVLNGLGDAKSSKADFTRTLDELVIVPDGVIWYVPFEALPAGAKGAKYEPLLNRVKVRYAPTVGLALGDTRRRRTDGNMGVVLGRIYPGNDAGVVDSGFDGISRAIPEAVGLRGKLPAPGAIYGSLLDRLIVLNEIIPTANAYDWSPLQSDIKAPASPLSQWLSLPFSGPEQVMLPGFRTPAERGLKGGAGAMPGNDLFLATCGLMATGARTVLISRWRTGGQTSVDLVREFAQELPHTTASDAWQRSVQLVSNSQVNVAAEPRLNIKLKETPPKAEQPFFWAGFLLADTGALPMTDEEEEAAEKVLAAKLPDDKPAGEKPADNKAADMKPNAKPVGNSGPGDRGPGERADNKKPPEDAQNNVAAQEVPAGAPVDPPADVVAAKAPKQPTAKAKRVRPPPPERKKPGDKQKGNPA
jgi:hypothetical protein